MKNVRTFQALAQKSKDFSSKNGIQGLPLTFKDFSRLCEPGYQISDLKRLASLNK